MSEETKFLTISDVNVESIYKGNISKVLSDNTLDLVEKYFDGGYSLETNTLPRNHSNIAIKICN